jgi:quercetin dioxygenase-like cupin family protein
MRIIATLAVVLALQQSSVVMDNARVRVYRTDAASLTGVEHGPGVIVWIDANAGDSHVRAVWRDDVADRTSLAPGSIVVVQMKKSAGKPAQSAGSAPGSAPFVGMSFTPLFENAQVSVLSARMEVDAREGFHTHGSDTLVVHLSGGEIEDTADGKTVVNRWKRGDVEFEALGSSHSARNVGRPVDVILVALKP